MEKARFRSAINSSITMCQNAGMSTAHERVHKYVHMNRYTLLKSQCGRNSIDFGLCCAVIKRNHHLVGLQEKWWLWQLCPEPLLLPPLGGGGHGASRPVALTPPRVATCPGPSRRSVRVGWTPVLPTLGLHLAFPAESSTFPSNRWTPQPPPYQHERTSKRSWKLHPAKKLCTQF